MKLRCIPAVLLLAGAAFAQADIVVVAHPKVVVSKLPQAQVARIFLGVSAVLPGAGKVVPRAVTGPLGVRFANDVLRKTPEELENYWRRMTFRGLAMPPQQIAAEEVKAWVAETPGAISYMERSEVDDSVKIIEMN